jgi:predicted nucleic acid-binding Zn ribbon protein
VPDPNRPRNRFCPSCGTEIEGDARFCPTCGTPLEADEDLSSAPTRTMERAGGGTDAETEPPSASTWPPPPEPVAAPEPVAEHDADAGPMRASEDRPQPEPAQPPPPTLPPPTVGGAAATGDGGIDLPFSWPTTLSGWLIGGGSLLGAAALIPTLDDAVSLLLFLALLGVGATVFLAERMPEIPRLRLVVLSVTLIGLGVGFDRAGFGARGIETVLLVAMIGAAGGALLVEVDRDRPLPLPR